MSQANATQQERETQLAPQDGNSRTKPRPQAIMTDVRSTLNIKQKTLIPQINDVLAGGTGIGKARSSAAAEQLAKGRKTCQ